MLIKKAKTVVEIDKIISNRWSARAFDNNKTVSRNQVMALCEAARWAPSCYGDEPWRYLVFDKNHNSEDYQKAFDCLVEWNQKWAKNSQVLMFAFADSNFRKNGEVNRWGQYDTGASVENICLQAVSLGLTAHQMAGFDEKKIYKDFNIPENYIVMSITAIGYQAESDILDKESQKLEIAERKRRPLGDNFFDGKWEKSI